jgi:hypothetical protein
LVTAAQAVLTGVGPETHLVTKTFQRQQQRKRRKTNCLEERLERTPNQEKRIEPCAVFAIWLTV